MELERPTEPKQMYGLFVEVVTDVKFALGQLARDMITEYMVAQDPDSLPVIILPGNDNDGDFRSDEQYFRGFVFEREERQVGSGNHITQLLLTRENMIIANSIIHPDQSVSNEEPWQYLELSKDAIRDSDLALQWAYYGLKALKYLAADDR